MGRPLRLEYASSDVQTQHLWRVIFKPHLELPDIWIFCLFRSYESSFLYLVVVIATTTTKKETEKEILAQVLVSEKLILWEDFPRVRLQGDLYNHQIVTWRRGIVRVNTKKVLNGYKTWVEAILCAQRIRLKRLQCSGDELSHFCLASGFSYLLPKWWTCPLCQHGVTQPTTQKGKLQRKSTDMVSLPPDLKQ